VIDVLLHHLYLWAVDYPRP